MDETVILPSPNWYLVSGMAVTIDGWIVYSGPSKSLCVLEPLPSKYDAVVQGNSGFRASMLTKAHPDKIISIDISPEWPRKRSFITGSADGSVKQWLVEQDADKPLQIKTTHVHDVHKHEKEEIAGVGYSNETYAITVGTFGNLVKWDINSNVVKNYNHFLKSFKPTCMSCSPHSPLVVAVGTRQGVVFVINLNAPGEILYKVRSHDEEITNISWCPQFEVTVNKSLNSALSTRLENIRNEREPENYAPELVPFNVSQTNTSHTETVNDSNSSKNLNESEVVQEDDMFDIYKDHESDEFGHKKYQPEDIYVKVKTEKKEEDFLAECLRLKGEILKLKNEPEPTIESLVEALDNTHVASETGDTEDAKNNDPAAMESVDAKKNGKAVEDASSVHIQRHLLAAVGKQGGLKIFSKSGKPVSSCIVPNNKYTKNKPTGWCSLLWLRPNMLLVADGKSQLLEIDPLKVNCKNKLQFRVLHSQHKRGLYCIASPKTSSGMSPNNVWTVGQDRRLIEYSIDEKKIERNYMTCGGFVYDIRPCPYDARKIAIAVGDGAVRVWEADTPADSDSRLTGCHVAAYWQNVQGKVLQVAWHPTRENLLAFGTAEARVGLLDVGGKGERPARVLQSAAGGVYSLCWGEGAALYAAGGGELLLYDADKIENAPTPIPVEVEGAKWKISSVTWTERGLLVGSQEGAVAVLDIETRAVIDAVYPFNKVIHDIDWKLTEAGDSLIAVTSSVKTGEVAILELAEKEHGSTKLSISKLLPGHKGPVHRAAWSPHRERALLTTSHDATVRVWDVTTGECVSIFGGHHGSTLGAAWSPQPGLEQVALSGGGDYCVRLWRGPAHPAAAYTEPKPRAAAKKEKKKKEETVAQEEVQEQEVEEQVAAELEGKAKASKKMLLPLTFKKIASGSVAACWKLLQKHLEKNGGEVSEGYNGVEDDPNSDYIRIFGSINEVNELLDEELSWHQQHQQTEPYVLLCVVRGQLQHVLQYAAQRDLLCPVLLSIAPSVSFKYWKEVTQMYLAQIDRLVAKGEQKKLDESKSFGGPVYRKLLALLSLHDARAAAALLAGAGLHKEAYALCRVRHMDSVATEVLEGWARHAFNGGSFTLAATCYVALGELRAAARALARSAAPAALALAAELARLAGQPAFADHIAVRTAAGQLRSQEEEEEQLAELPTRMQLLMREKEGGEGTGSE